MVRELIVDVLLSHRWGDYDESGLERKDLFSKGPYRARCKCGWTTLDCHEGKSEWIDHSDHVSDAILREIRSRRMVDRIIEHLTGYARESRE